jgi:hypothetical protein
MAAGGTSRSSALAALVPLAPLLLSEGLGCDVGTRTDPDERQTRDPPTAHPLHSAGFWTMLRTCLVRLTIHDTRHGLSVCLPACLTARPPPVRLSDHPSVYRSACPPHSPAICQ